MNELTNLNDKNVGDIYLKEPLAKHSSWCIGGPADILIEPYSVEQIINIVKYSQFEKIPLVVIGNGTNLLFCDDGVRGIVIKLGDNFSKYIIKDKRVYAEAGILTPKLVNILSNQGLSGIEHAIGIPGTLGGLVFMNGGSGRKCIGDVVKKVWVVDRNGNLKTLSKNECDFSYRKSSLQDSGYIVYNVEFECEYMDKNLIKIEMNNILHKRKQQFPVDLPNCGSVFLSDSILNKIFASPGKLIEDAGLKGFRIGDAQISEKHANFIVNLGKAKALDILTLVKYTRKVVNEYSGNWLKSEVKYVEEMGEIKALHEVE